jgi:hypothetical protein
MAKCRTTHSKSISEDNLATSHPTDVESTLATDLIAKPRPKPRPLAKPGKKAVAPVELAPDPADETPHLRSKRGHSRSIADETVPASIIQPPAKKTKISNITSPVQRGGNVGAKAVPRRSPRPLRTNRVVNPGAPDKKRNKRTSEEVAAAAKQKRNLRLELEQMEREKIRMLAEMEAVEEEEELDEERMGIKDFKDIANLAESQPEADSETDTQYSKAGDGDNDIVMADNEEVDDALVEAVSEPELEEPKMVKMVSEYEA